MRHVLFEHGGSALKRYLKVCQRRDQRAKAPSTLAPLQADRLGRESRRHAFGLLVGWAVSRHVAGMRSRTGETVHFDLAALKLQLPDAVRDGVGPGLGAVCVHSQNVSRIRDHCCYAYSVWIASSLRADIIFGKDKLEQVAKLRQSSLAILRARCQGQTK